MSVQVEKLEGSMAKLTIEVSEDVFEKAVEKAYQRQKGQISIPGFRKGKVARQVIEKMYGPEIFYDDAANTVIRETYDDAVSECGESVVSEPVIDVVQIGKGKAFIYSAEVALKPPVTLGQYKGVEIDKIETEVTDADVDAEIEKELKKNARTVSVTDRKVAQDDTVILDFEGFCDGVAFEGGKGTNYSLKIGSGTFIPGFEEQLVGAEIGTELEVNVTFPEEYQAEELAGKPAVFKCLINEIKEEQLPELDDEFASDAGFDSVDEYKADLKKNLEEKKVKEAADAKENAAVDAAVANSTIEIPAPMLKTQQGRMIDEFAQQISYQGLSFDQYLQFTGSTREQLEEQVAPQAESRIRSRLTLEAVAEAEKLDPTDEQYEEEVKTMAEAYGREVDEIKKDITAEVEKMIKDDLRVRNAVKFITDNAVEK